MPGDCGLSGTASRQAWAAPSGQSHGVGGVTRSQGAGMLAPKVPFIATEITAAHLPEGAGIIHHCQRRAIACECFL